MLSVLLTVAVLLTMLVPAAGAASVSQFTDVPTDSWYYNYVDFVTQKNYFNGVSATEFAPAVTMTRAMFVTVLARLEGAKVDNSASTQFSDVPAGQWYTGSVAWAAGKSIVNGTSSTTFDPNAAVSRQEMCTIMNRYISYVQSTQNKVHKTPNPSISFSDQSSIASWAVDSVKQCVYYGLILGYENDTFRPTQGATRAEVSAVIYRLAWLIKGVGGGGGGGGGGSVKTTYYQAEVTLTAPFTFNNGANQITLTSDAYTVSQTLNAADLARDLIGETNSGNKNAIMNAIDTALDKAKDSSRSATSEKGSLVVVNIDSNGVITATEDGNPLDMVNYYNELNDAYNNYVTTALEKVADKAANYGDIQYDETLVAALYNAANPADLLVVEGTSLKLADADSIYAYITGIVDAAIAVRDDVDSKNDSAFLAEQYALMVDELNKNHLDDSGNIDFTDNFISLVANGQTNNNALVFLTVGKCADITYTADKANIGGFVDRLLGIDGVPMKLSENAEAIKNSLMPTQIYGDYELTMNVGSYTM